MAHVAEAATASANPWVERSCAISGMPRVATFPLYTAKCGRASALAGLVLAQGVLRRMGDPAVDES
jgi:hypothetical protein